MELVTADDVPVATVRDVQAMPVAGARVVGDVALEDSPVRLPCEKRVVGLSVGVDVQYGHPSLVLARGIAEPNGAHAVAAPLELEAVDGDVVCTLQVDAGLPAARTAVDVDAARVVRVPFGE